MERYDVGLTIKEMEFLEEALLAYGELLVNRPVTDDQAEELKIAASLTASRRLHEALSRRRTELEGLERKRKEARKARSEK